MGGVFQAVCVAGLAREALLRAAAGRVLSVFDSAAYLETEGDDIVAVTGCDLPRGPFTFTLAGTIPLPEVFRPGEPLTISPESIQSSRTTLTFGAAETWEARPRWEQLSIRPEAVVALIPRMEAILSRCAPPDSLAALLPGSEPPSTPMAGQILGLARRRADAFCRTLGACGREGADRSTASIEDLRTKSAALAGLGGGYTPAGDDFLLGAIYALCATRPESAALPLAEAIAEGAAPHTTKVSAAYLRAGARGAAGQAWHSLVEGLADGQYADLTESLRDISRIGHTSGADALTGYVMGLGALLEGA
jgi:hypothetical protein